MTNSLKLKEITEVHIIESPGFHDIEADRKESYSLGEMLRLSNIPHSIYNTPDIKSMSSAFDAIIDKTLVSIKTLGAVTIHLSMHGNKDGLGLTSGEFVSWEQLAEYLQRLSDKCGGITFPSGCKISPVTLVCSSCEGLNAYQTNKYAAEKESLFQLIVGPSVAVSWSDALVAYMVFYHNHLSHNISGRECISRMNLAANLESNIFQAQLGKGVHWVK